MKLSSIIHRYIQIGRQGSTASRPDSQVSLSDTQLLQLWEKASHLESIISCFHSESEALCSKYYQAISQDTK